MMLVDADSAIEHRDNEDTILAKADHTKIAKFERHQGTIYPPIRAKIQSCLAYRAPAGSSGVTGGQDTESDTFSLMPELIGSAVPMQSSSASRTGKEDAGLQHATSDDHNFTSSIKHQGYYKPATGPPSPDFAKAPGPSIWAPVAHRSSAGGQTYSPKHMSFAENKPAAISPATSSDESKPAADCSRCNSPISVREPFYRCIIEDHKNKLPKNNDWRRAICKTCYSAQNLCTEHKMNLVQYEVIPRDDKSSDLVIFIDRNPQAGDSALIVALKRRDLLTLDRLAADSFLREATDANGYTPLMIAAHFGAQNGISMLLKHGANLEAKTVRSWTALSMAVSAKQIGAMTMLLHHRADALVLDNRQSALLHSACRTRSAPFIHNLIGSLSSEQLTFNLTAKDNRGHTAFAKACLDGQIDVAKTLLTALLACDIRPDVTEQNKARKAVSLVPRLVQLTNVRTHILPLLIKHNLDLNAMDYAGETPLHVLALEKETGFYCNELIRLGANPNIPTREMRETILHIAVWSRDNHLLRQILTGPAKIEIDAKNIIDCSAFYLAACTENYEACKLLLQHSANIELRCETSTKFPKGLTALHTASFRGYPGIVKLLVAADAYKERLTDGSTPLYAAASRGHLDVVRVLVSAGANINFKRTSEDSVTYIARKNGHNAVADYLVRAQ
jgi:ankyrin repeat protein